MKKIALILGLLIMMPGVVGAAETAVEKKDAASPAAAEAPKADAAAPAKEAPTPEEISRAIKLRIVAVNPSKDKVQKVPIKIYMPKEVIPDDIIDMGQLKVGYDSEKSMYFAYDDAAELKPLET